MSNIMGTVISKPTNHYTAMENIDQLKLLLVACYPVVATLNGDDNESHELKEHLTRLFNEGFLKQ